ncbi:MAG: hypothetical protein IH600_17950 [Bacteroidetes bacterium]|nr:hypothetical protein [Bacteroidota bacterium]
MNCSFLTRAVLAVFLLLLAIPTLAQRSAGDRANIDPQFLVDMPVAGIIPATAGAVETYLYPDGGVLASFTYGLMTNLNIGLSFGGTRLIGSGGITWDNLPGLSMRYRVMEESMYNPAVVVGFDSQGHDGWVPFLRQYVMKSPGFFVAASKNYQFYGTVSFHGGANYTLERNDDDFDPNIYVGAEKSIGPIVSWLIEYNFAFDNDRNSRGFWNGSLGTGVRVSTNIGFNVDILFKNLLTSEFSNDKVIRAIRIQYVRYL